MGATTLRRATPPRRGQRTLTALQRVRPWGSPWSGPARFERARPLLAGLPGIVGELNTWGAWRAGRRETALALRAYLMSLELDPGQAAVREAVARAGK